MKFIKIALMLCITSVVAQSNYVEGSITTINNETINGEIDYKEWRKTPENISFKQGESVRTYRPEDLLAFSVKEDKFISRKVVLDITEQRIQDMDMTTKPKFQEAHIFLNLLVNGDLDLYEYNDTRPHYFYGKDGEVKELVYRLSFSNDNGDLFKSKQYLGQFRVLMNTCESIEINDNIDYKRKDLIKIVSAYNTCVSSSDDVANNYVKKREKVKNRFYATAGYYFSSFKIDGISNQVRDFDKGNVSRPSFGLAYEIIISKNLGKWSMYTELTYNKISGELDNTNNYNATTSPTTLYDPLNIDFSAIDLSILFRYSFAKPEQKLTPFINLGFSRSQLISEDIYVTRENTVNGTKSDVMLETINGYFNLVVGAGIRYNKLSAELRYVASDKIINEAGSNGTSNVGLMLGYQLF